MKTLYLAVASVSLSMALFPLPAAGETVGVVAVAEAPGPSTELAELTHQFRVVMAERTAGVVEATQLRERMTGKSSSATLAELDRAYAGALAVYQNGDFEGAVRTLRVVIEDLEKLPDGAEAFSQWERAVLRLARALQTLGRKAESKAALERLVRANPNPRVDPNQYPPSFQKQIEETRRELAAGPRRKLSVTATLKGARVFVDGRDVGAAPVALDLPAARYRVSGAHGQLRVPGLVADLTEDGQAIHLNFALSESFRPSFGPGLALPEAERSRSLVTAGAWLGVDRLVAARFEREGEAVYFSAAIYEVRRGMLQREGRVRLAAMSPPPGSLSALATFLITGQASSLVAATSVAPVEAAPPPSKALAPSLAPLPAPPGPDLSVSEAPRKSKVLGWSALGCLAAGAGLGVFAVVKNGEANDLIGKANGLVGPNGGLLPGVAPGQYNSYIGDANSARSAAQITGGAAIALVVGSGVLGYLSYKQTGEVGPFRF